MKDSVKAAKLWPEKEYLQKEWMRAVNVVRSTKRGWVAEDHLKGKKRERSGP